MEGSLDASLFYSAAKTGSMMGMASSLSAAKGIIF
jgi:hypothetical protein